MNLNQKLREAMDGAAYLGPDGLRDYHRGLAVKNALRRKDPSARLSGVREALNQYRLTAWLVDGKIEVRKDGKPVLTL